MEAVDRIIYSNDWITGIFLLSLVLLVLVRDRFNSRFVSFIILPFNNKYVVLFNKKGRLMSGFHLLMSVLLWLNLSLFLYLITTVWEIKPRSANLEDFSFFLIGILAFTTIKVCLQLLAGYIFNLEKLMRTFLFNKGSYLNFSALILFFFNLLLVYLAPESKGLVIMALALSIIINLIGWATLLKSNVKYVTSQFFYFILYLCALEIAPFVIVPYVINV